MLIISPNLTFQINEDTKMSKEMEETMMSKMKDMPSFMTENEDETYTIKCRKRDFILKELSGGGVEKSNDLASKSGKDEVTILIQKSLITPEISDMDFSDAILGHELIRLKSAITWLYGLMDFL